MSLFCYNEFVKKRKEFFSKIEETIDKYGGKITIYDTIDLELARKL